MSDLFTAEVQAEMKSRLIKKMGGDALPQQIRDMELYELLATIEKIKGDKSIRDGLHETSQHFLGWFVGKIGGSTQGGQFQFSKRSQRGVLRRGAHYSHAVSHYVIEQVVNCYSKLCTIEDFEAYLNKSEATTYQEIANKALQGPRKRFSPVYAGMLAVLDPELLDSSAPTKAALDSAKQELMEMLGTVPTESPLLSHMQQIKDHFSGTGTWRNLPATQKEVTWQKLRQAIASDNPDGNTANFITLGVALGFALKARREELDLNEMLTAAIGEGKLIDPREQQQDPASRINPAGSGDGVAGGLPG